MLTSVCSENADFVDEGHEENGDVISQANISVRQQWMDLRDPTEENCERYIRLHGYIAQLMGLGLVKGLIYPISVLHVAFERQLPEGVEGDRIRDAAFSAATKYWDHAGKELLAIARQSGIAIPDTLLYGHTASRTPA